MNYFWAIVVAVLSVSATHWFASRRSFTEYRLKKLEDVSSLAHKYSRYSENAYRDYKTPHALGVCLESSMVRKEGAMREAEINRRALEIIISFYFPELRPAYENLCLPVAALMREAERMEGQPKIWSVACPDLNSIHYGAIETPWAEIAIFESELHTRILDTAQELKDTWRNWPFGLKP